MQKKQDAFCGEANRQVPAVIVNEMTVIRFLESGLGLACQDSGWPSDIRHNFSASSEGQERLEAIRNKALRVV